MLGRSKSIEREYQKQSTPLPNSLHIPKYLRPPQFKAFSSKSIFVSITNISRESERRKFKSNFCKNLKAEGEPKKAKPKIESVHSNGGSQKIQKRFKRLTQLSGVPIQTSLAIVSRILTKFSGFLGTSQFFPENCWVNQNGQMKINSESQKNCQLKPMPGHETKVGGQIMQSVLKVSTSCFRDFFNYYQRSLSKHSECDFKNLKSLLRSYLMCTKFSLPDKFEIEQNDQGNEYPKSVAALIEISANISEKQIPNNPLPSRFESSRVNGKNDKTPFQTARMPKELNRRFIGKETVDSIILEDTILKKDRSLMSSETNIKDYFSQKSIRNTLQVPRKTVDNADKKTAKLNSTNNTVANARSFLKSSLTNDYHRIDMTKKGKDENKKVGQAFVCTQLNQCEQVSSRDGENEDEEEERKKWIVSERMIQNNWNSVEGLIKSEKKLLAESITIGKQIASPLADSKLEKLDRYVTMLNESLEAEEWQRQRQGL